MTARTLPTEPGWWWADVDGDRRVVEVWPHADFDVLRFSPRHGVVWSVDDERLVDGVDGFDTSDGERIPEVVWVTPVAPPGSVPPEVHARANYAAYDDGRRDGQSGIGALRTLLAGRLVATLAAHGLTPDEAARIVREVTS